MPKCLLCVLGYGGLGIALGWSGPEVCGASASAGSWIAWLALAGAGLGAIRFAVSRRHRR